jgi:hypothetical protein
MSILGDIARDAVWLPGVAGREKSVLTHIADCHTERMGGNTYVCACGHREVHYNSCRDRHCPLCQGAARALWVKTRLSELLPVPYFHVVFTVPQELLSLAYKNQRFFYTLLMTVAQNTLLAVCGNQENLGGRVGGMSVLHTWNQKLGYHPHVHCIVPSGGIATDGTRWIPGSSRYLVPVKRLSRVFRGKLLSGLEGAIHRTVLAGDAERIRSSLKKAVANDFVVYAKPPFGGPEQVVKYLGRYTHRVGISEQRMLSYTAGTVRFSYIDRKACNAKKVLTLPLSDFVRKFVSHILPKGFRKIRYFGFLGNRDRTASISTVRTLIKKAGCAVPISAEDVSFPLYEPLCPTCGLPLRKVPIADGSAPGWLKNRLNRVGRIVLADGFRSTA